MKYLNFKLLILFAALALAIPPAWAETVTVTLTQSVLGLTGSYTTGTQKTVGGITYQYTDLMKNSDDIQAKASTGEIHNVTAYPGNITSVAITHSRTARPTTILGSSDGTNWTQVTTGSGSITGDFSNKGYKYFKITRGSNAAYWPKIEITYETSGPTKIPVTLGFPSQNYTATLGQSFTAPTLSVDPTAAASAVAYSSSNTSVATVDASTGAVEILTTGQTVITAAISGSDTYFDAEASYTLTVEPDLTNAAVLDFRRADLWDPELPTGSSEKFVEERSFYDGTYTVKIAGSTGEGCYWNTDGYLLIGKQGAYIQLPAFNRAVTSIDVEGTNTASGNVTQNIFVGGTEVSTQTLGKGNHSYDIASDYQAAGNIYTLKVTNGYNTQIKRIIIHFDENAPEVPVISVTPSSVTITDATGDDKTGTISATVDPAGTVNATATDGWSATASSVTYQGFALHAEGTATFSSQGATDVTADLEYNYTGPLYILGTVNNGGWAPNNYVAMTRGADGLYTVRVTTNAGNEGMSWISFTKRIANDNDNGAWGYIAPYRFVPYSEDVNTAWWLTDGNVNQFNALDFDLSHVDGQPVRMAPGTYDITINPNDNTFKIEPYIVTVETPTFNPEAGSYHTFQSVAINCATQGATIHYTTDGSEPTESSPVYSEPISVESTTTIKAIAMMNGMANSAVAEATYTLPQNLVSSVAQANTVTSNGYFLFTTDNAVVTYAGQSAINSKYHYIFIRDIGAENGGGVIFYNTNNSSEVPSVQAKDVLKRGWYARVRPYNDWIEFQSPEFVEASGQTAAADPFDRTGQQLTVNANVNEYIKIDNVTYSDGKITYAGQNREDVTYTYTVVNHFNVSLEEGKHYNIEGVVTRNNSNIEFYPTAATIAQQDPNMSFAEQTVNATFGADFNEPALTKPEGVTVTYTSSDPTVAEVDATTGEVAIKKVGNARITATSVENQYYTSGTASYNIVVTAGTPTFAYSESTASAVYGTENPALPTLNNPNGLTVTYSSSNSAVATVNAQGEVAIVGAGTTVITATGAATGNYQGATATYTLTVTKAQAKVEYSDEVATATFGTEATLPTVATTPANLPLTYSSSHTDVATVDAQGVVSIVGIGQTTITAKFEGNGNYETAEDSYTLTVNAGTPTFAYSESTASAVYGTENPALPTLNNPYGLSVTYSSSNSAVATVNAQGEVAIVGAGTTVITATGAATGNYQGATATYTLTVTKAQAKVEYSDEVATATFGTEATLPTVATTPANLPLTYSSSHTDVATVDAQGVVSIVGIGQTTITAKFEGNGNYETAEDSYTLTVNAGTPTFAYSESTASAVYGTENPALPTLNNPYGLSVTYSSSNSAVATVNAQGEVAIVGAGTTVITATGAATGNYQGATATYTLTVTKAQAKVEYSDEAATATFGTEATLPTVATTPANLPLTYSSSHTDVATVDAQGVVSIVGIGQTTITAKFEGNGNYETAEDSYTLTVNAGTPTFAYSESTASAVYGTENPALPTLNNPYGLSVTYSSSNSAVATVNAQGEVAIVGAGTTVITATGAATGNYQGATATYTLTVTKAQATLTFAKGTINATIGGEVEANPLTNEANLGVTYSSSDTNVATVDASTGKVNIVGTGSAIITATGEENANYLGTTATYTINVAAADAITFTLNTDVMNYTVGDEVKVKVDNVQNAIGDYTITYKIGDTELTPENGYVTIPTAEVGEVTLTVTVKDAYEHSTEATQNFVFNIAAADAITFTLTPDGGEYTVGDKVNVKVSNIQNTIGDYTITYTTNSTREPQTYDPEQGIDITSDEAGQVNLTVTVTDAYEHAAEGTKSAVYKFAAAPAIEITLNPDGGEYIVGDVVNVTVAVDKTLGDYTVVYQIDGGEAQNYDAATGIVITRSTVGNVDLTVTVTDGYEHEGDGTASATYVFKPVPVVAAPTFSLASGTYDTPQDVTITGPEGATIYYSVDGGLTWTEGNSRNMTETTILMAKAVKDGIESPVVTNAYVIKQTVERIPVEPIDGYFSIKNNGNNMFANVQGRKTLTFCDDAAKEAQAGTVIYVKTDEYGQVQSLRSQAADLQGYADRAMRYVPEVVQLVVDKLHATGVGSLLGEDGYDAIMEKFNESFDYHLYVEKDGENYRIYGKTPSMQPVVDFYAENMSRVDEKLPMLEDFINDAIDKVLNKTNGHGASILVDYDLEEVWQRMGGNLTKPEDEASTMAFYRQVLCNKDNVWNFAYQSVMIYWERLKNHDLYEQMKEDLGEFANYVDKLEQVLPDMKYYIVADGNKVDYISAGNGDIINGAARTYWTLVPRTTFTKNFDENNYFGCILNKKYVATLYTDFAYTLPEDVKAYKVTRVSVNGLATLEALSGAIPAQTPVLLMSEEAGDKVLNLSATGTADMAKNLLVGPDYLIDEYKLVTPQVQGLFNFVKQYVSEEFYNTYVTPYEHLMYKNSGTVGNKYFWGLPSSDLDLCVYTNAENSSDCVVRSLGVNEATGTFGFVDHWNVRTNEAFLVSSEVDEIRLSNRGDVNHDGVVDINDVTLTISRVLGIPTPDCCPYCADVVETGVVDIDDVTELINIVLGVR